MILYASTVWAQCITSLYLHSFPIGWILLLATVYISGTKILNSWLGEGMVPSVLNSESNQIIKELYNMDKHKRTQAVEKSQNT